MSYCKLSKYKSNISNSTNVGTLSSTLCRHPSHQHQAEKGGGADIHRVLVLFGNSFVCIQFCPILTPNVTKGLSDNSVLVQSVLIIYNMLSPQPVPIPQNNPTMIKSDSAVKFLSQDFHMILNIFFLSLKALTDLN